MMNLPSIISITRQRIIGFIVLLSLLFYTLSAQDTFYNVMGGNGYDYPQSFISTQDGGFLIGAVTSSYSTSEGGLGQEDIYALKLDECGEIEWSKTYGGDGEDYGYSISIRETSDNNYLLAGYTTGFGFGGLDNYVAKLDQTGNIIWARTYGGSSEDYIRTIYETNDGGLLMATTTTSYSVGLRDIQYIKTDSNGEIEWAKAYGFFNNDNISYFLLEADESTTGFGTSYGTGAGSHDAYIIHLDSNGDFIWSKTYGGSAHDAVRFGQKTADGGYIAVGFTESDGFGGRDILVFKTNDVGEIEWEKLLGNAQDDLATDVAVTPEGDFIIAGYTDNIDNGIPDIFLMKMNSAGALIWSHKIITPNGSAMLDFGEGLRLLADGSIVACGVQYNGFSNSEDILLIKFDADGTLEDDCEIQDIDFNIMNANLTVMTQFPSLTEGCNTMLIDSQTGDPTTQEESICPCIDCEEITFDLGEDMTFCDGYSLELNPNLPTDINYEWQDGSNEPSLWVNESGVYWLTAANDCSEYRDSITLTYLPELESSSFPTIPPLCSGETFTIDMTNEGAIEYLWQNGSNQPNFTIEESGLYWIEITGACDQYRDSLTVEYIPVINPISFSDNTPFCEGDTSAILDATVEGEAIYEWQNGDNSPIFSAAETGTYSVTITNDCESIVASTELSFMPSIEPPILANTAICSNDSILYDASTLNATDYLWSTGDEGAQLMLSEAGAYWVEVMNSCDLHRVNFNVDSINTNNANPLLTPNAFTPNKDGLNDYFSPIIQAEYEVEAYYFTVYDRWGTQVFLSTDFENRWDGKIKGEELETGVYVWYYEAIVIEPTCGDTLDLFSKGNVSLIR